MWLVLNFLRWEGMTLDVGLPMKFKMARPEDGSIGYCSVFDNYDKALRCANGDATLVREIGLQKEV